MIPPQFQHRPKQIHNTKLRHVKMNGVSKSIYRKKYHFKDGMAGIKENSTRVSKYPLKNFISQNNTCKYYGQNSLDPH